MRGCMRLRHLTSVVAISLCTISSLPPSGLLPAAAALCAPRPAAPEERLPLSTAPPLFSFCTITASSALKASCITSAKGALPVILSVSKQQVDKRHAQGALRTFRLVVQHGIEQHLDGLLATCRRQLTNHTHGGRANLFLFVAGKLQRGLC